MFQTLPRELPIATGKGDATKQTAAINEADATKVQNREAWVFLKSVPLYVFSNRRITNSHVALQILNSS
jgi:hypothetical protein